MKKFGSILILALMMVTTVGITVTKHYCGDMVSDIYITYQSEHCGGGMEDMGCCHNEQDRYVIDSDFQFLSFSFDFTQVPVDLHVQYLELGKILSLQQATDDQVWPDDSPPPTPWPDIYTRVQSFLL